MNTQHYDLVILGSGSTAFAAALRAQELGKRAVMTEERTTGGTCVNRGCLPSKNLIEAARLVHDARHPRYPGIEPHEPTFDFRALVRQKDEIVAAYRQKKYASLVGGNIQIAEGHVAFLDPHTVEVGDKRFPGVQRVSVELGKGEALLDFPPDTRVTYWSPTSPSHLMPPVTAGLLAGVRAVQRVGRRRRALRPRAETPLKQRPTIWTSQRGLASVLSLRYAQAYGCGFGQFDGGTSSTQRGWGRHSTLRGMRRYDGEGPPWKGSSRGAPIFASGC